MENKPNKPIAVIEITSNKIRFVVGYYFSGKVQCLYSDSKDISSYVSGGKIIDEDGIVSTLRSFSKVQDNVKKLEFKVKEIVLVIPGLGLNSYSIDKKTKVISPDQRVDKQDITIIVTQVATEPLPVEGETVLDVVPRKFFLDDGSIHAKVPLGDETKNLGVQAVVYAMQKAKVDLYHKLVTDAGFSIKKMYTTQCASAELFNNLPDFTPMQGFFYVDIGANFTTISVVSSGLVFNTSFIERGGNIITDDIANSFRIEHGIAEKIKRKYGYSTELIDFDPPVHKSDIGNTVIEYKRSRLNQIIEQQLEDFCYEVKNAIGALASVYQNKEKYSYMPIILGGGGSRLNGLVEYMKKSFPKNDIVRTYVPTTIGLRNQEFSACIGSIKYANEYHGSLQEHELLVTSISRVGEKKVPNRVEEDGHESGKEYL